MAAPGTHGYGEHAAAATPTSASTTAMHILNAAPPIMKFTSMVGVSGAIQTKNMSSSFMKEDGNSWWSRRLMNADAAIEDLHSRKRKRVDRSLDEYANGHTRSDEDMGGQAYDETDILPSFPLAKGKGKEVPEQAAPDPSKVIVIHPGSRTLRIGKASDSYPWEIPNVIARRRRTLQQANGSDSVQSASRTFKQHLDEDKLDIIRLHMRERMRILNLRGTTNGSGIAADFNATVESQRVPEDEDPELVTWTNVGDNSNNVLFAEEALRIADADLENWSVRWPFHKGSFNTSGYASAQELLADIADIWCNALRDTCEVDTAALHEYSVILLISDLYEHVYLREMCDLILRVMGFRQLIVQQESLAASFAAGLPSACVVDLGASKVSVSCIDEGFVINDTRMLQSFGGDDITETFLQVLGTINFPFKDVDLARQYDWSTIQALMQQCCAFNEINFNVTLYDFLVRRPAKPTLRYTMKLYDEGTLPTFCLWTPRILDWDRKLLAKPALWASREGADDVVEIGGDVVTAAMKRSVQHLTLPRSVGVHNLQVPGILPSESVPMSNGHAAIENGDIGSPSTLDNSGQIDVKPVIEPLASPNPFVNSGQRPAKSATPDASAVAQAASATASVDCAVESSKLPLDVAVCESIAQTGSDDKVKRVITNILIVGGLANLQGAGSALQQRLIPLLRQRFPTAPAPLVIPTSKYADPGHMAWKGISSLCKLDVANDLWIRQDDWELMNLRALRDRAYFSMP